MPYKFLLFDLDHTLLDFDAAEEVALNLLLEEAEVADIQAYKDYYIPMNREMWADLSLGKISKSELIRTRFSKLFSYFGQQIDGELYAKRYQHFLSQQGQSFAGAEEFLDRLSQQGYQLFAATNGVTFIQKGRLRQSTIDQYFQQIFISDEVGHHKPSKGFYDAIECSVSGFDAGHAVMIGDSLTADIQGANNAGMDSIWYNPKGMINQTAAVPTFTAKNYAEILKILENS